MKHRLGAILFALLVSCPAWALEQIIRPYQSVRTSGMGGALLTTGIYEENLLNGNPARHSGNKIWKFFIADLSVETNATAIQTYQSVTNPKAPGTIVDKIGNTAGSNNHFRAQANAFHVYLPNVGGGKMSYALGIVTVATQADVSLRRNFQIDPTVIAEAGPSIGVSRKFMKSEALVVGVNLYGRYRLSANSGASLTQVIQGKSLVDSINPMKSGGEGGVVDFDLGGTFRLPWRWRDWSLYTGATMNNGMGGNYSLALKPLKLANEAMSQRRRFGFGFSAQRTSLWKFNQTMVAIEAYDIGNNPYGSTFRLLHLGAEFAYGVLRLRTGLNQGYWAAGLGLATRILILDFATYGEEMSLNMGSYEDRRYSVRLSLQI